MSTQRRLYNACRPPRVAGTTLDDSTLYSLVNHQLRSNIDFCPGAADSVDAAQWSSWSKITHPLLHRYKDGRRFIPGRLSHLVLQLLPSTIWRISVHCPSIISVICAALPNRRRQSRCTKMYVLFASFITKLNTLCPQKSSTSNSWR